MKILLTKTFKRVFNLKTFICGTCLKKLISQKLISIHFVIDYILIWSKNCFLSPIVLVLLKKSLNVLNNKIHTKLRLFFTRNFILDFLCSSGIEAKKISLPFWQHIGHPIWFSTRECFAHKVMRYFCQNISDTWYII